MNAKSIVALILGCHFAWPAPAEPGRARSKAGREEVRWFNSVGAHHLADENGGVTRTRALRDRNFLEQLALDAGAVHKYGFDVDGTPYLGPVVRLTAAGPSRHYPAAVYPALTPWIMVRRATPTPAHAAGQKWRALRPLQEEEQILAIARRLTPDGEELMRVQRFFWLRAMNQQISVSLMPADEDGAFRAVRVSRNGVVGEFRVNGLMIGEIVGFRATHEFVYVTTSARVTYQLYIEEIENELHLRTMGTRSADAAAALKVIHHERPADARELEAECAGRLAAAT